jgi:hypothetical protein
MVSEMSIQGDRYAGKFSIQQRTSESDEYIDGEYAARWEKRRSSWWEGKGVVEDTQTGNRERFLFVPKGNSKKDIILCLKESEMEDKTKVDLSLQSLYEQAKYSKEILPVVELELITSCY